MLSRVLAIVDIGSNSVKILVAKMQQDALEEIHVEAETTSLARGLPQTGKLSEKSIEATLATIRRFREKLDELKVTEVRVVGTAALREASNAAELTAKIESVLGFPVSIISGEEEARISLRGALTARPDNVTEAECSFADLGGASTEIGYLFPELEIVSTSLGALKTHNLLEMDGRPVTDEKWEGARLFVHAVLDKEVPAKIREEIRKKKTFIAVGGTIVMAARAMGLQPFKHNCYSFRRTELEDFAERLRKIDEEARAQIPNLKRDRADILPFGMLILTTCMKYFDQATAISTVRGLRHGLALSLLSPQKQKRD